MKRFNFFAAFMLILMPLYGQSKEHFTISGYVREAVSGESLIGVNIYLADHKT
jgi:hypothetical protein